MSESDWPKFPYEENCALHDQGKHLVAWELWRDWLLSFPSDALRLEYLEHNEPTLKIDPRPDLPVAQRVEKLIDHMHPDAIAARRDARLERERLDDLERERLARLETERSLAQLFGW